MIRVKAGPAREVKDTRMLDEGGNGFLDVSALDEGDGIFADLVVGRLNGIVLSWHDADVQRAGVRRNGRRCWISMHTDRSDSYADMGA